MTVDAGRETRQPGEPMSLVILAAGLGRRFGGAKQIEAVGPNDEALMEYSIFDALASGFGRIVFVIRGEQETLLRERLERRLETRCELTFVHQSLTDVPEGMSVDVRRRKPWGTGHAVWSCRHVIDGPFAVVNADDFYGRDSFRELASFLGDLSGRARDYALVGFELEKTLSRHGAVSRGICRVDGEGFLIEIEERAHVGIDDGRIVARNEFGGVESLPSDAVASMNLWGFPSGFFGVLEHAFTDFLRSQNANLDAAEFYLPTAVDTAMSRHGARVRVLPTNETWMGLTFREDIERVRAGIERLIQSGIYPRDLWGADS